MLENGFAKDILTEREQVILALASDGKTDQAIADSIGFAKSTLVNYWTRIRLKLSASSKTEAVSIYKDLKSRELVASGRHLSKKLEQQMVVHEALKKVNAELLEAQDRLKRQTQRLAEVIWGTNIATWDWNVQTGEIEFNNRWAEMLGYTLEELEPVSIKTWVQFAHQDDLARARELLQRCFRKEIDNFECEVRLRSKSGGWVWVLDRGRIVEWTSDGKALRMSGIHLDITDRKIAEQELRASEERFRNLSAVVSEGIMIHRDYIILDANQAFASFVGVKHINDLVGRHCLHLMPLSKVLLDTFEEHRKLNQPSAYDIEITHPNGKLFYAEARGEDIDYHGQPARLVSIRDITQRKLSEKALIEQEQNFRTAFETIGDMIFVARFDGVIIYTNSAVERKLGYKASELVGKSLGDLHPEADREEANAYFLEMIRGERDTCPFPWLTRSGETVFADTRVWLGHWSDSDCVFAVSKDLGPLLEAHQRFEKLFRKNPALMALTMVKDRRYYDVNDTFLETLGYSKKEVLGKTSKDLGIFVDTDRLERMVETMNQDGSVSGIEHEVRCKDGRLIHGLFSAERIICHGQQFYLTLMVDVTDRKMLEAQLIELHKLEALGTIAGGIAHDFNNLLALIQGNAVLAKQYMDSNMDAQDCLSDIDAAAERAKRLVQQILAFSQGKAEDMRVQPLSELVREACRFIRTMVPPHVEFCTDLTTEPIHVKCSSTHIYQLLVYMCSMAWQALAVEGGRVVVALDVDEPNAAGNTNRDLFARLSISDNRPESDVPTIEQMFNPFCSSKDIDKGAGFGLSIVQRIVSAHGGTMMVQRSEEHGMVYTIFLPLSTSVPEQANSSPEPILPNTGAGKSIIIIDDETDLVTLIERILSRSGYVVHGFCRAGDALAYLSDAANQADLVVTDYNMPQLSGLDVSREIRALRPELPIAIMSGYVTDDLKKAADDAGAQMVFFKENTVSMIAETINEVLRNQD